MSSSTPKWIDVGGTGKVVYGSRLSGNAATAELQREISKLDTDLQVGLAKLESSILRGMISQAVSVNLALAAVVVALSIVALIR